MQAKQGKRKSEHPTAKTTESSQKAVHGAGGSTRLPAWTNVWGDNLPAGLVSPVVDLQTKQIISQPGDPSEREAEQIAHRVMASSSPGVLAALPYHPGTSPLSTTSMMHVSRVPPMIQRLALEEDTPALLRPTDSGTFSDAATGEAASTSGVSTAEPTPEAATPEDTSTPSLIVDNSVDQLAPGQMKKSDFLAQLRDAVCTTTEQALAGTIWSAAGCPWVDHWFGYYSNRDSQQIERAIRRYAPGASNVTSASDYIPLICERVRRAISVWSATGEITGVPEGIDVLGAGLMGVASSVVSGISSVGSSIATGAESIASGVSSVVSGVGSALSSIGNLLFKGREGGAREASNPQAIQGQLGAGRSLDGGVRSQMESTFGMNFSHVRVHTDATAAGLSESLNARAFTVGRDVAFGSGEYQPGTLIGDALIAHELAHVVQQGKAGTPAMPLQKGGGEYNALEEDADQSAVGAIISLWDRARDGVASLAQDTLPRLRSGLALQRCALFGPQLQSPQKVKDESEKIRADILAGLSEGDTKREVELELDQMEAIYKRDLKLAGSDTSKQAQAQKRFLDQLHRLYESYKLQLKLTQEYGIRFTAAPTRIPPRSPGSSPMFLARAWSRDELVKVDAILQRVPKTYLSRVQKIERAAGQPTQGPEAGISTQVPAAWDDSVGKLYIYDAFFDATWDEKGYQYLLHEIGHSTDPALKEGGFTRLPNEEWRKLSDWKTSAEQNLGKGVLDQLKDVKRKYREQGKNFPDPIRINNRMVVPDRYEENFDDPNVPPTQYLHYDAKRDEEFVTPYARSHPADDLAESFARYLLDPDDTKEKLDHDGKRPGGNKWQYLVRKYPGKLKEK
jgi:hypothetical protein